jgi:hypothetical protein
MTNKNRVLRLFYLSLVLTAFILWVFFTPKISHNDITNVSTNTLETKEMLKKSIAMKRVFARYNSPFVDEVDSFIKACTTYDIDCYLLPSISGIESGFGKAIMPNSYNAFGWGGGLIYFKSWEEGILTVAKGLYENYFSRGLTTPELIAPVYAPPSTTWALKVNYFMGLFIEEEKNIRISIPRL